MNTSAATTHRTDPGHWSELVLSSLKEGGGRGVVFHHQGPVDPEVLRALLGAAEEASIRAGDGVGMRKRLFNILVEGLENVLRHTTQDKRSTAFAVLLDTDEGYRLLLGNALPVATAALLTQRVAILNEMDEADLREHFLKFLANDARTDQGGAGLGLITMARKSARPMVAHVLPCDEFTAYFALEVAMLRG
ncbi:MAG: hypothetical protein IPI81_16815 [Flavobacteriales bacterium]|nr:hypothetical protein [Flavobacteriales bacterium]MCC6939460.1 hypothetical protein [Flavobacteriales bacterium]